MRIAIVNDVHLAVAALKQTVQSIPGCRVAWIATDGRMAVERCRADVPDLILMDLIMPEMDGVEATRLIMQQSPCTILVVTVTVEGNAGKVFDAMGYGALDAAYTPMFQKDGSLKGAEALIGKIHTVSQLIPGCKLGAPVEERPGQPLNDVPFVAVGVSTGGPSTLVKLLTALPTNLPITVGIVQHIDARFSKGLVRWLDGLVAWPVEPAQAGAFPQLGHVYVAVSDGHLLLGPEGRFVYQTETSSTPYCPSVDHFFHSLAEHCEPPGIAVLLTGMGSDGAKGLLALRQKGWRTLAQDEASSVIYGMPKAAVELGAAEEVGSIEEIAETIVTLVPWHHRTEQIY